MTAARTVPSPERSHSAVPGTGAAVRRRGRPGVRRTGVLLLLLTAAVVVGSSVPSWATYTDTAAVSTTVATATVAPPAGLRSSVQKCTGNSASVRLDWTASTSARVSGYRIRVHLGGAWQDQGTVGATTTTWQGAADRFYVDNYTMTFSVWTLTDYGWTAESARTERIVC